MKAFVKCSQRFPTGFVPGCTSSHGFSNGLEVCFGAGFRDLWPRPEDNQQQKN